MIKIKFIIIVLLVFLVSCTSGRHKLKIKPAPVSSNAMATFYYLKYLDLAKAKKYNDATKAIKQAISYNPSPELYIEYARLLLTLKNIKKAREILKLGLQKNPGNRDLVFFLADIYTFDKKFYNAYSLLKIYLKENQKDIQAREKIAKILFEEKKFQNALKYLLAIPEKNRNFKIHYFLGKCYLKIGDRTRGIYHLKKATELNPDFFRGWAELAYQYELSNDLISAEKIYSRLLSQGFSNKELILRLIDINIKLNKPEKAYSLAQDMISDPKDVLDVVGLFLKGEFYNQSEQLLKTIENFKDEYPKISYYNAIIELKKYNDIKKAIKSLEDIKPDSKIYPAALEFRMKLLLNLKKYEEAAQILEKQIEKHPDKIPLYLLLSEVYIMNEKYEKAKMILDKALKKEPDNVDLLFQLGTVYYKLKDIKKSLSVMEKILKINPNHASALNFVGYTLIDEDLDLKKGYKFVKKALTLEPENGYFLDSLAWYYYKIKDYKMAWEKIKKAIKKTSIDPTIWEHYGDIALKVKKFKEAEEGYKNALLKGPEHPERIKEKLKKIRKSN